MARGKRKIPTEAMDAKIEQQKAALEKAQDEIWSRRRKTGHPDSNSATRCGRKNWWRQLSRVTVLGGDLSLYKACRGLTDASHWVKNWKLRYKCLCWRYLYPQPYVESCGYFNEKLLTYIVLYGTISIGGIWYRQKEDFWFHRSDRFREEFSKDYWQNRK